MQLFLFTCLSGFYISLLYILQTPFLRVVLFLLSCGNHAIRLIILAVLTLLSELMGSILHDVIKMEAYTSERQLPNILLQVSITLIFYPK